MKRKIFILVCLFLLMATFMAWFFFSKNEKIAKKEKQIFVDQTNNFLVVKNELRTLNFSSEGQISQNLEMLVFFNATGKLEAGDIELKQGTKFKFNQLLYKIDSEELFHSICAQKASLAKLILEQMNFIESNFQSEKSKWQLFLNEFSMVRQLPEFPEIASNEEKLFILESTILSNYLNIKSLEKKMSNYIFLAPFDGIVTEVYSLPGMNVQKGSSVAKISKSNELLMKTKVPVSNLSEYKKSNFVNISNQNGSFLCQGKLNRISNYIDTLNQTIELFYSFVGINKKELFAGQKVLVSLNGGKKELCFSINKSYLKKNKIFVLKGNKRIVKRYQIIDENLDSIFVTGFQNGDTLTF
jgi:hypothetical protein